MSALDDVRNAEVPTQLELAVMFYGDEQSCDDDQLADAEEAADELARLQAVEIEFEAAKRIIIEADALSQSDKQPRDYDEAKLAVVWMMSIGLSAMSELETWKAYALHQEVCAVCSNSVHDCESAREYAKLLNLEWLEDAEA